MAKKYFDFNIESQRAIEAQIGELEHEFFNRPVEELDEERHVRHWYVNGVLGFPIEQMPKGVGLKAHPAEMILRRMGHFLKERGYKVHVNHDLKLLRITSSRNTVVEYSWN